MSAYLDWLTEAAVGVFGALLIGVALVVAVRGSERRETPEVRARRAANTPNRAPRAPWRR